MKKTYRVISKSGNMITVHSDNRDKKLAMDHVRELKKAGIKAEVICV